MIPHERSLVEKYKDSFVILGVNTDKDPEKFLKDCKENEVTWPSFFDTANVISTQWGVRSFPTLYLIDAKGVIRSSGSDLRSALDQEVEKLVKEREAK